MPYRVIQWYTGTIAQEQIRMIQGDPNLELVGAARHRVRRMFFDRNRRELRSQAQHSHSQ